MTAVEDVAVGESPLSYDAVSNSIKMQSFWQPWGGFEARYWTPSDDRPLSSIPLAIPLNCSSQQMALYRQIAGSDVLTEEELNAYHLYDIDPTFVVNDALVPNCTFRGVRQSGIYDAAAGEEVVKAASIVEEAMLWPYPGAPFTNNSIPTYALIKYGVETTNFALTPDDKTLAKDRANWKEGRTVEGVDGIRYGDLIIEFNHSVIASGPMNRMDPKKLADASSKDIGKFFRIHDYLLVATPKECPLPPSGAYSSNDGLQCLVYIIIQCPMFNEDVEPYQNNFFEESSQCTLAGRK